MTSGVRDAARPPRPSNDAPAQDWFIVPEKTGKLVAKVEDEYTWRDDDRGLMLYVLQSPSGRGTKLETLNNNGLVVVDIKERLVRITITDVVQRITYRYQWLNLWGRVIPDSSSYRLSKDKKRIVVWLQKLHDIHEAGPWGFILDVRTGRYCKTATTWPGVLCEVQGTWRSEDEEPLEIVGHQVVWPEGSRDVLKVDEAQETFHLVQLGDSDKVTGEEFFGFYERHCNRIKWDDGDCWTRLPGLAVKRHEAGKEVLPLEYDLRLSRWVPWLPPDEMRRQAAHWMPPTGEISVEVALADSPGIPQVKRELLESVVEDVALEDNQEGCLGGVLLADFETLPARLLQRCRICALAGDELEGPGLIQAMLALRDQRRVSLANEAAALQGLERWLQWLLPWLAPGSRRNVWAAVDALRERQFEVVKEERKLFPNRIGAQRQCLGRTWERWPPLWTCTLWRPNDLLQSATMQLVEKVHAARAELGSGAASLDPDRAFADARRRLGERLFENVRVDAVTRRCDPLERRWARRYAQEASRSLLSGSAARPSRQDLHQGGFAVVEDVIDWGTLVKIHGEVAGLLNGKAAEAVGAPVHLAGAARGSARWTKVWEAQLVQLGAV